MLKIPSERPAAQADTTLHGPSMGTRWSVRCALGPECNAQALHQELAAAVAQVDAQMSPYQPTSDLLRLNHAPPGVWVPVPAPMLEVLACALEIGRLSDGAFDIGVGALVQAWGFGALYAAPDAQAIHCARSAAYQPAHTSLELDASAGRVRKHAPLHLDLCGIAKGYAVDGMVAVLQRHGVVHALAAIDGELRAVGQQAHGQPWPVALEQPDVARRAVHGVIELQDIAVATSGDYRHFWEVQGQRLAHSMDARRRAPVRNEVASVTVLARHCMHADAWATALLVAGPSAGMALAQRQGLEALWLLRRGERWVELGLGRFRACA